MPNICERLFSTEATLRLTFLNVGWQLVLELVVERLQRHTIGCRLGG